MLCVCVYIYIYIHIYICRERERMRERENCGLNNEGRWKCAETDTHIKFLLKNCKSYITQRVATHELL